MFRKLLGPGSQGGTAFRQGEVSPVTPQATSASGMRQMAAEGRTPRLACGPPPAHASEVRRC